MLEEAEKIQEITKRTANKLISQGKLKEARVITMFADSWCEYLYKLYGYMEYRCRHCGSTGEDEDEKEFIADGGYCISCDHVMADLKEEL